MLDARLALVLALALSLLPLGGGAQTRLYRWVDANGKVHYTDKVPTEAAGRATEELNRQGTVLRKTEAAMTAEQREQLDRERKKHIEDELAAKEERRKNMALLNTYSSERDIEEARGRALRANEEAAKDAERKIAEALKRQEKLKGEAEFYLKKPMPKQLKQDMQVNELELRTQLALQEAKKKEVAVINARYDEDKRRYIELSKAGAVASKRN